MAVASSLFTTLTLLPLRHVTLSPNPKPPLISFSLHSTKPSLFLRSSPRAPLSRLFAAPPESDGVDPNYIFDESKYEAEEEEDAGGDLGETKGERDESEDKFEKPIDFEELEDDDDLDDDDGEEGGVIGLDIASSALPQVKEDPKSSPASSKGKAQKKSSSKYQIRIKLKSYWVPLIEDSCKQIIEAARTTNAKTMGPVPLPTKKRVYCVLKSPHKHKDAREHFEIRTHQRLIDVLYPTADTIDSLMRIDFPAGVDVQVKV